MSLKQPGSAQPCAAAAASRSLQPTRLMWCRLASVSNACLHASCQLRVPEVYRQGVFGKVAAWRQQRLLP